MANRKRNKLMRFFVSEKERELIKQRMNETGFRSLSAYLRKRAIDVHLININLEELNELKNEINKIGVNVNQLIRKYHYDGNLTAIDIDLLKKCMKQLSDLADVEVERVTKLLKLSKANGV